MILIYSPFVLNFYHRQSCEPAFANALSVSRACLCTHSAVFSMNCPALPPGHILISHNIHLLATSEESLERCLLMVGSFGIYEANKTKTSEVRDMKL